MNKEKKKEKKKSSLQTGPSITKRGNFITNWGWYHKVGRALLQCRVS